MNRLFAVAIFAFFSCSAAKSGEVDVLDVKVSGEGTQYRFSVTLEHADTGWDHYADAWEVVDENGVVFGKRVLAHPHVNEQPFTRSGMITIPEGVKKVVVRAHDSVHGIGGAEMIVTIPGR